MANSLSEKIQINTNETVYSPHEDTFLMARAIMSEIKNASAVEVGCGSGYSIIHLSRYNKDYTNYAIDLNFEAVKLTKQNMVQNNVHNIQLICGNLYEMVRRGSFKYIFFNPPYLPADPAVDKYLSYLDKIQFVGGKKGFELTSEIINQLKCDQILYVIISSLATHPDNMRKIHPYHMIHIVDKEILDDGETLWVLKVFMQ